MRYAAAAEKISIACQWDASEGFLLCGRTKEGAYWPPLELKANFFAWHKESFYGTFIPEAAKPGFWGIKLSPVTALDFFAEPPRPEFLSLQWSAEILQLHKTAPVIRELLIQGKWLPDYDKWREGRTGWKLMFPPDFKLPADISYLAEWVDAIINELMEKNTGVNQAWQRVVETFPLLHPDNHRTAGFIDEEDWLTDIGWLRDNTPFRTCLQLAEPDEESPWTLNILLQDKNNPDLLVEFPPDQPAAGGACPDSWLLHLDRPAKDMRKWIHHLPWLENPEQKGRLRTVLTEEQAWEFLTAGSIQLAEAGFSVLLPAWWDELRKLKPRLKAKTRSSVGSSGNALLGLQQIVQFDWKLAVGDLELSAEEFSRFVEEKKRLMKIRGRWVLLDPLYLQQVRKIMKTKHKGLSLGEVLQMHLLSGAGTPTGDEVAAAEDAARVSMEVELNDHLARLVDRLTQVSALPMIEPSPTFRGVLRKYQRTGSSWLLFLRRFGLGGCLADDMGLGKTIQWISYLLDIKDKEQGSAPSLLICPTSVIGNWQMELKRFAPTLQIYVHYGPQRSRGEAFEAAVRGMDLVITSYALAHLDQEDLNAIHWNCICLDEAQNIKNAYTKQAAAIRKLAGSHKVALTGTPMENRLTELWSIMDFLNPGYLGSLTAFNRQFVKVIEKTKDAAAAEQVRRLVRPFLLRRVKKDPAIELDLPEKQEFKEYVTLTMEQASLYEHLIDDMFHRLEKAAGMERRGIILATLIKLKQVCNHPAQLLKEGRGSPLQKRSNKVGRLLEMVEE
ncbi:MAG: DEAD/DEAH box helicase, partial [Bacillota bacterium]